MILNAHCYGAGQLLNVTNDNAKRDGTDNMETAGSVPQLSAKIFLPPRLLVFKNACDCILDKSSALIRAQIA